MRKSLVLRSFRPAVVAALDAGGGYVPFVGATVRSLGNDKARVVEDARRVLPNPSPPSRMAKAVRGHA